jgi:hypothetical protein
MSLLKTVLNWFKPISKISLEPELQSILNASYNNKVELYNTLSEYTLKKYSKELEELNNVFTSNVITIKDWRQYVSHEESNNGKKIEIAVLNYLKTHNIEAESTRGQGLDITIGNKIIDVKSSEKNTINTQLQTSFYTDNPSKFYIFVTNTKKKDIELRIISSQILRQINLGYNIFNELHTFQQSNTLDKEITNGLKTLDFKHFITNSITQGKSADATKSFKIGNDVRVRFVIYIEPK